jgi:hypothetical protein
MEARVDHPTTAPETALAAIEQALQRLETLPGTGMERLQQLAALDTSNKAHAEALAEVYVGARRLSAEEESRLWGTGHGFHARLAQEYARCRQDLASQRLPEAEVALLLARQLFQQGRSAVWRYFRYLPHPPGWWLEMHSLYAIAEGENIAAHPVTLYADEAPTSCAALYLHMLLLGSLNRSNMSKRQIENVYYWLLPWAGRISLDRMFNQHEHLFYVDLDEDREGRRVRNFTPSLSCRYWNTDPLAREIAHALHNLETGAPQLTGLEPALLHALHAEWSRTAYKRQRRSDERDETTKYASVANGIYAVCQEVQMQVAGQAPLDMNGELWQIENESSHGFGATVSTELNTWLKIGRLIALREELNLGMGVVGVVRSLKQLDEGKVYVGVEILSHMALYAVLQELHDGIPDPQMFPGVFLPSDEARHLPTSLLLPAIEYQPGMELRLRLDRVAHRILLREVLEQQDDWVRVGVEVLGEAT